MTQSYYFIVQTASHNVNSEVRHVIPVAIQSSVRQALKESMRTMDSRLTDLGNDEFHLSLTLEFRKNPLD